MLVGEEIGKELRDWDSCHTMSHACPWVERRSALWGFKEVPQCHQGVSEPIMVSQGVP